jgi:YHS domain-containing protein
MKSADATVRTLFIFSIIVLLFTGCDLKNVAIKGYDPVAYFTVGKAVKGNEGFSYEWHNATWFFSTSENSKLFASAPAKYAPQYDGYCAWAMSEARKASTDPEVWKIVNGKLYLNCSRMASDKWSRDIPGNIKKADANWLKLSEKK